MKRSRIAVVRVLGLEPADLYSDEMDSIVDEFQPWIVGKYQQTATPLHYFVFASVSKARFATESLDYAQVRAGGHRLMVSEYSSPLIALREADALDKKVSSMLRRYTSFFDKSLYEALYNTEKDFSRKDSTNPTGPTTPDQGSVPSDSVPIVPRTSSMPPPPSRRASSQRRSSSSHDKTRSHKPKGTTGSGQHRRSSSATPSRPNQESAKSLIPQDALSKNDKRSSTSRIEPDRFYQSSVTPQSSARRLPANEPPSLAFCKLRYRGSVRHEPQRRSDFIPDSFRFDMVVSDRKDDDDISEEGIREFIGGLLETLSLVDSDIASVTVRPSGFQNQVDVATANSGVWRKFNDTTTLRRDFPSKWKLHVDDTRHREQTLGASRADRAR